MPNYHRTWIPGGTYFFTLVTYQRRPLFQQDVTRQLLRQAFRNAVQKVGYFQIIAFCLLPDHLHCIWTLPPGDQEYSKRWQVIKSWFSMRYLKQGGTPGRVTLSNQNKGERGIWQRRYWEHSIRNIEDLNRHIDYIHFNPVKHGLVSSVKDWPCSTFHRYVRAGFYDLNWGEDYPRLDEINAGE